MWNNDATWFPVTFNDVFSALQKYTFFFSKIGSESLLIKALTGKGVERREPSCTVGGNVNWYNHYGEHSHLKN